MASDEVIREAMMWRPRRGSWGMAVNTSKDGTGGQTWLPSVRRAGAVGNGCGRGHAKGEGDCVHDNNLTRNEAERPAGVNGESGMRRNERGDSGAPRRVCGNPHAIIRKYGLMCCRQCFRSNAKEIGFIKVTSSTSKFQTAISALDNRLNEEQRRYPPTGYHSLDTTCWIPPARFFPPGHPPFGYPPIGYPPSGYPLAGYPPSGYPLFEYPGTSAPHHDTGGHHGHQKEKHGTS
ncbi:hypothetical protein ZIOFF_007140 [Zingiber officinale]|uniref:40S ribosomal protein S29 n=1 Tax=Zingiber officinale TaxID=94328 RepID=A0A8J5I0I6_ZINOF|nr:hypothetical protein ZIOFF_007140 [Zingiber officinale]